MCDEYRVMCKNTHHPPITTHHTKKNNMKSTTKTAYLLFLGIIGANLLFTIYDVYQNQQLRKLQIAELKSKLNV